MLAWRACGSGGYHSRPEGKARGDSVMEGRVLAQRYQLVAQLGQGGMGSVWKARHLELGTPAAIKLISPDIVANPEALARFKREAQAAAALRSPHVVQILDYGVDGDTPYIAMELLEGESLAQRLERCGRLSLKETAAIVSQVARAVSKAHAAGIVHRDLKPDNIFVVDNDDDEVAKVLDFGIAKSIGELGSAAPMHTGTGVMLGTPYYMSPEQAAGKKDIDRRTDTWALTVIAYECVTGARPFASDTLGALVLAICTEPPPCPSQRVEVPQAFDQWFLRGVARNPDERFQTARELADELRAVAEGSATHHGRVGASVSTSVPASAPVGEPAHSPFASTTARQAGPTSISVELPSKKSSFALVVLVGSIAVLAAMAGIAYRWLVPGDLTAAAGPQASPLVPAERPAPDSELQAHPPTAPQTPSVSPAPPASEVAKQLVRPSAKAARPSRKVTTAPTGASGGVAKVDSKRAASTPEPLKRSSPAVEPPAARRSPPATPETKPPVDLAF